MTPILRALAQLDDPALRGVVLQGVAWAAVAFVALAWLMGWGGAELAAGVAAEGQPGWVGWLGWLAGAAGVVGAAAVALFLFVPVATAIASQFVDRIAEAVERRHFPGLAAPAPASMAVQLWDGFALGLNVLAMQVVALTLSVVLPGPGLLLGWLVTAWAIGRGLFMAVALRRCDRTTARLAYRAQRGQVLVVGAAVAAAGLVPVLNLAAPVIGLAAMVHVLGRPPAGGLSPPAVAC